MVLVYILLAFSALLNLLFIIFDVMPYLIPDVKRKFKRQPSKAMDKIDIERRILDASIASIKKRKTAMIWNSTNLYQQVKSRFSDRINKEFKNYNYPRAYLMYGVSEYLIKTNNNDKLIVLKYYFDNYYISNSGQPRFKVNKVDQAVFGIIAINLHLAYKEEKYKVFASVIFDFIHANYVKNSMVLYRENTVNELNDTIGMIVPFLVRYYKFLKVTLALEIARNQLAYFIKFGTDVMTYLPCTELISRPDQGGVK